MIDPNAAPPPRLPFIRTRYVDTAKSEGTGVNYYEELRSAYSPNIQKKSLDDQNELYPEDKDHNMVALDHFLHLGSSILNGIGRIVSDSKKRNFKAKPIRSYHCKLISGIIDNGIIVNNGLRAHIAGI